MTKQSEQSPTGRKYLVGILGATGVVGQRLIQLLDASGGIEIEALGGNVRPADEEPSVRQQIRPGVVLVMVHLGRQPDPRGPTYARSVGLD